MGNYAARLVRFGRQNADVDGHRLPNHELVECTERIVVRPSSPYSQTWPQMNRTHRKRSHHCVHEFGSFLRENNLDFVGRLNNPSPSEPILAPADDFSDYGINAFGFYGELPLQAYRRLGMRTQSRDDVWQRIRRIRLRLIQEFASLCRAVKHFFIA